jgi:hypothetical protein
MTALKRSKVAFHVNLVNKKRLVLSNLSSQGQIEKPMVLPPKQHPYQEQALFVVHIFTIIDKPLQTK